MKPVTTRFTEEELKELDMKAKKAKMNRSDYIRYSLFNHSENIVQVIDKSTEFYQSLQRIFDAVCYTEKKYSKTDFDPIKEEVSRACQLLNL